MAPSKSLIIITIFSILILSTSFSSAQLKEDKELARLDYPFYRRLSKLNRIRRDQLLNSLSNRIITGRGLVKSKGRTDRFGRKNRIVLHDEESEKFKVLIIYYIYTESEDSFSMLNENDKFEFRGQLVLITPLDLAGNKYILDIILEKGTILIE